MRAYVAGAALLLVAASGRAADQSVDVGPSIAFSPSSVTVSPGDTVTWTWQSGPHSSTSDTTSGPEVWDSGIQSAGFSFTHTFQTPGDYPFYCQVHSSPGGTMMNGVVHVVAAPTPTPTVVPPTPTVIPPPVTPGATAIPTQSATGLGILGLGLAAAAIWLFTRDRR